MIEHRRKVSTGSASKSLAPSLAGCPASARLGTRMPDRSILKTGDRTRAQLIWPNLSAASSAWGFRRLIPTALAEIFTNSRSYRGMNTCARLANITVVISQHLNQPDALARCLRCACGGPRLNRPKVIVPSTMLCPIAERDC